MRKIVTSSGFNSNMYEFISEITQRDSPDCISDARLRLGLKSIDAFRGVSFISAYHFWGVAIPFIEKPGFPESENISEIKNTLLKCGAGR